MAAVIAAAPVLALFTAGAAPLPSLRRSALSMLRPLAVGFLANSSDTDSKPAVRATEAKIPVASSPCFCGVGHGMCLEHVGAQPGLGTAFQTDPV